MLKKLAGGIAVTGLALLMSGCEMVTDVVIEPDGETAVVTSVLKVSASQAAGMMEEGDTSTEAVCEGLNEENEGEEGEMTWEAHGEDCVSTTVVEAKFNEEGIYEAVGAGTEDGEPEFSIKKVGEDVEFSMPVEDGDVGEAVGMGFNITFNVTFPEKVIEYNNNGVLSEDGKTVTWNFSDLGDEETIEALGSVKSSGGNIGIIIGVVAIIAAGALVGFLIYRKKKDEEITEDFTVVIDEVAENPFYETVSEEEIIE